MAAGSSLVCLSVEPALVCELGNERQAGNKPQERVKMGWTSPKPLKMKILFCFALGIQHWSDSRGVGISFTAVLVPFSQLLLAQQVPLISP